MGTEKKREIIEEYAVILANALKEDPKNGHDTTYYDFKKSCSDNGYIDELQDQMWQSIVKRVAIEKKSITC